MTMFWVFLIIVFVFVSGGLLNARPSAMQKRISILRSNAFEHGLHVKLPVSLSFPPDCVKSEHAYYCKQSKVKTNQSFVHLFKDINSNIVIDPIRKFDQAEALKKILHDSSQEYLALYIGNGLIGVSWNEMTGERVPDELLSIVKKTEDLFLT